MVLHLVHQVDLSSSAWIVELTSRFSPMVIHILLGFERILTRQLMMGFIFAPDLLVHSP